MKKNKSSLQTNFSSTFTQITDRIQQVDPVSSTNKIDRHDVTEILLKVTLNTITLTPIAIVICLPIFVIKFVSDLQQVGGFRWVLRFLPPIKLTAMI